MTMMDRRLALAGRLALVAAPAFAQQGVAVVEGTNGQVKVFNFDIATLVIES
jgi:hypothetical protein